MPRSYDKHQAKVYLAEDSLTSEPWVFLIDSPENAQFLSDSIIANKFFTQRFPIASCYPPKIRNRKGKNYAHYDRDKNDVALPWPSENMPATNYTLYHELAHYIVQFEYLEGTCMNHGREFRGVLVWLLEMFVDNEAARMLECAYADQGLDHSFSLLIYKQICLIFQETSTRCLMQNLRTSL